MGDSLFFFFYNRSLAQINSSLSEKKFFLQYQIKLLKLLFLFNLGDRRLRTVSPIPDFTCTSYTSGYFPFLTRSLKCVHFNKLTCQELTFVNSEATVCQPGTRPSFLGRRCSNAFISKSNLRSLKTNDLPVSVSIIHKYCHSSKSFVTQF